ncbi:MAG TPA: cobalamin-binding protein [Deltaproteobacteria bacterium]|nr:cobalamin-binding protein [Deltaproteobacteria bacterium]
MASFLRTKELLKSIHDAVVEYDEEKTAHLCKLLLKEAVDPYIGIMEGLAAGMNTVGQLYDRKEYFVPELLLASDAFYAGLEILKPHIKLSEKIETRGKILLGVVEGDIHDIGKNLVKTMFEAAGWEICDLGKDVKLRKFVEELEKFPADIVAMSALMTTSMLAMPRAIEMLKESKPDILVMVGGAPLSREIAEEYGADGYAADAVAAVEVAARLIIR